MLGHPEAMIAPLLGLPRQLDGMAQGIHSVIPAKAGIRVVYRALVEDAQLEIQRGHRRHLPNPNTGYWPED